MNVDLSPPLKWHGGKHYLAKRIIALMPKHIHYVEPYFGGGSVLLAKDPEGVSEVVNDLNRNLVNFWNVLACESEFPRFVRMMEATPFAEDEWTISSLHPSNSALIQARDFFVRCRQSLAGRMAVFAPLSRTRTRRGMNEQASAWLTTVEGLPAIHARLKRVAILNRPALDVIRQQDGPDTLFYLDPPYLHETRASTKAYGEHEMSSDQHQELLEVIAMNGAKAKFMISGYDSGLYSRALCDWNRHDFSLPNNAAGGQEKRRMTECLWCNF